MAGEVPPADKLPFTQATGTGLLIGGYGLFKGLTCEETSGAAGATFQLWDTDTNRALLAVVRLAAGESLRDWFAEGGVQFQGGVFLNVGGGAFRGSVFVVPGLRGLAGHWDVSEAGVLGTGE